MLPKFSYKDWVNVLGEILVKHGLEMLQLCCILVWRRGRCCNTITWQPSNVILACIVTPLIVTTSDMAQNEVNYCIDPRSFIDANNQIRS